jgi:plasmid stabilization system protein ParE
MTLEVRLRPEAEDDLLDAAAWYEQQLPGLGQRFPFGVFYQVEEDRVVVIAVLHGSRHPRAWQRRA